MLAWSLDLNTSAISPSMQQPVHYETFLILAASVKYDHLDPSPTQLVNYLADQHSTKHLKFFTLLTYATIIIAMFSADTQSRNSRLYQDFIKALRSSIIFSLQNIDTVFLLLLFNIPNPGSPSSSLNKAQLTAKIYWILVMAGILRPSFDYRSA
ncbi:hypothetical protein CU097_003781 [Rhizopus azygosporus]|uniref:Uncharacterized protein n=1 Tax=Rhizopus azygosporus TaxID=86630 RepID=A0A367K5P5_RHIAZ|nr:hypothetical protein CU097_003781 [Rhizopus azygosporus]